MIISPSPLCFLLFAIFTRVCCNVNNVEAALLRREVRVGGLAVGKRSKCALSFDKIHGLRNLMREPASASALDEVSR